MGGKWPSQDHLGNSVGIVTAPTMPTIRIDISHVGLGMEFKELPFDDTTSLGQLKDKLYPRTGTEAKDQQLTLLGDQSSLLSDDKASLAALGVTDGARLELVDTNDSSVSNTLDVGSSKVEKYQAKSGNADFAAFRKGKTKKPVPATADTGKLESEQFSIGMRVQSKKTKKTGTVRYIGQIEPLPAGYWLGVEMDEACGRNDGEVKGVRLFTCAPKFGNVMRPTGVEQLIDEGKTGESKENKDEGSDTEL